jgi:hypothetical protein
LTSSGRDHSFRAAMTNVTKRATTTKTKPIWAWIARG